LAKYEYLPELLSRNAYLINALRSRNAAQIQETNRYLQSVALSSGASDVYLMDQEGLTIAASNFDLDRSFVGRNFSFRPYFQQAVNGDSGRYFALGTTSLQRGFFFSYPIIAEGQVFGVVVVKVTLTELVATWANRDNHFIVTDKDGVIFLSTVDEWKFSSIYAISSARIEEIKNSRRYVDQKIRHLDFVEISLPDAPYRIARAVLPNGIKDSYLWKTASSPVAGWDIHALSNTDPIKRKLWSQFTIATFSVLILLLMATLYWVNRQRRLVLQESTNLLETRVHHRTLELGKEIDERRSAEKTLRDTQEELIQTAKMAGLGEISASISHELNQPLTAIKTYAETANRMLDTRKSKEVSTNLTEIVALTHRMDNIMSQLRGFSRKSTGERSRFSLSLAVAQSLSIFSSEIEQKQIVVKSEIPSEVSLVTDPVLFNQVMVNLVSNAIHALDDVENRVLKIDCTSHESTLAVTVTDTGNGIDRDVLNNIFDPFFTTKEVGLGLGMGLSISYRIMENLGGKIRAENLEPSGARFTIELPLFSN